MLLFIARLLFVPFIFPIGVFWHQCFHAEDFNYIIKLLFPIIISQPVTETISTISTISTLDRDSALLLASPDQS